MERKSTFLSRLSSLCVNCKGFNRFDHSCITFVCINIVQQLYINVINLRLSFFFFHFAIFNDIRVQSAGALLKANKIKRNQHGSKPRFKKSITAQVMNIISCRLYSRNFVLLLSCFDNSRRKTNLSVDLEFPGCYCCASFYGFVIDLR